MKNWDTPNPVEIIAILLTVAFVILGFVGIVDWGWAWVISPVWLFTIFARRWFE